GRAQQLRRDRELAQALAHLALEQQSAREQITDAASQLQRPTTSENDPTHIAAAQSMQLAQQQFAAAQMATGEGAAEVSGQEEVVNQPIREGLEIASRLNQGALPKEEGGKGQETGDNNQKSEEGKAGDNPKSNIQNPKSASEPTQLGTKMVPNSP